MNIERLKHLIAIMEDLQATQKAFNLSSWIAENNAHRWGTVGDPSETCGTTCCALGYAALDPTFRGQGLTMYLENDWTGERLGEVGSIAEFNKFVHEQEVRDDEVAIIGTPTFEGETLFDAGAKFFDITGDASFYLFDPVWYQPLERVAQPSDVVIHIKEVIELGGKAPIEKEG